MAGTAFGNPVGGLWPLGKITVAAAGTPVPINTNVGAQGQGTTQGTAQPFKMAQRIRGLIFSNLVTGEGGAPGNRIYLVKHGYTKTQTNGIIAVFVCGTIGGAVTDPQPINIPGAGLLDGAMPTIDVFDLDADRSGASCQVTAIYG